MRFATLNGSRIEASPKIHAKCIACGGEVISKCGKHISWHWAHLSRRHCDKWWESETEWHRLWKDRFPYSWQEVAAKDTSNGEIHIADIRTPAGLVIEFQRSTIDMDEVMARQAFYKKMIWVIDGNKNAGDKFNFFNMRSRPDENGISKFQWFGRSTLFKRWHTTAPVFIDFGSDHGFWRILRFDPNTNIGLAQLIDLDAFVQLTSLGKTDFSSGGGPASK